MKPYSLGFALFVVFSSALPAGSMGWPPTPPERHLSRPPLYPRFTGRADGQASGWERFRSTPAAMPDGASAAGRLMAVTDPQPPPPGLRFRPAIETGFVPTSAASGDFDGDGLADLIVASGLEDSLWLYIGRPDGELERARVIPLKGESPLSIETADLQEDGLLDLVVCLADSTAVAVLLGEGEGRFSEEWSYPVYGRCGNTVVRDFDGDGTLDIAVGFLNSGYEDSRTSFNVLDGVGLLKGSGDGTFQPLSFEKSRQFYSIDRIIAADWEGDKDWDLLAVSILDGVFPLINDGAGRFSRGQLIRVGPPSNPVTTAAVGDLDSDGCPDVVSVYGYGNVVRDKGLCDGTFARLELWQNTGNVSLDSMLLDLDGDSALDLVVLGARLTVMKGDGHGNLGRGQVFRGGPRAIWGTAGDYDGDGDLDLVSVNQSNDSLTHFRNDGDGDFGAPRGMETSQHTVFGGGASTGGLRFADLNRDGRLDILYVEEGLLGKPHVISTLAGRADGKFEEPLRSETFREPLLGALLLGDFRNSGNLDLVAIGQYEAFSPGFPFLAFAPGNGDGTFGPTTLTRPEGSGGLAVTGDFNRDGRLDLVTAGNESPSSLRLRITPFLGRGDGTFQAGPHMLFGGAGWPAVFHAADFNADGNLDLLVWAYDNTVPYTRNDLYQLMGKGDGTFHPARRLYELFRPFAVSDLNGDGLPDLVTSKDFVGDYPEETKVEIEVYLCRRDGTFEKAHTYRPFSGITFFPLWLYGITNSYDFFAPRLGDFNGDGLTDVAAFQYFDGEAVVQFLLGNGDGSFQPALNSFAFGTGLAPQMVVDLDGDGFSDLVELGFSEFNVLPGGPGYGFEFELLTPRVNGTRGYGIVRLVFPAEGATAFSLESSSPHVRVPANVEVAPGRTFARFPIDISAGHDWSQGFEISVSRDGQRLTRHGWQHQPETLYFPQIADGEDASLRFQTSLIFANTGDHGRVRVEFFDSDSRPMSLDLGERGNRSVIDAPLTRGSSLSLETAGRGTPRSGYARVTVFGDVGGTAVFSGIEPRTGAVLFEAGVPLTAASDAATIPVDSLNGYATGIAVVNGARPQTPPTNGEARMTARLYDQFFEPVQEGPVELGPGRHMARFVDQIFQQAQAERVRGALTVGSEQPVAVVALRQHFGTTRSAPTLTVFPAAAARADAPIHDTNQLSSVYWFVPQVGEGADGSTRFQTSLVMVNPGIDTGVNINFYDSAGKPMRVELLGHGEDSHFFFPLWEGQNLTLQTAGKGPLRAGYARVQAARWVSGTAIFTASEAIGGRVLYEAGIPFSRDLKNFTVYVDSTGTRETGLALVNGPQFNDFGQPATIRLRLYDESFRLLAETSLQLPFGGHLARYVHQLFPNLPEAREMRGVLTVSSDQPLEAVTLRQDNPGPTSSGAGPTLTAFPVIAGRADF